MERIFSGIVRDAFSLFSEDLKTKVGEYPALVVASDVEGELRANDFLLVGDLKIKVAGFEPHSRSNECLTGAPVPGGQQYEFLTNIERKNVSKIIGLSIRLVPTTSQED